MNDELDDWQNLVKSPGWFRLNAYATREYSDLMQQHIGAAANETDDVMALNKLRQVVASQKAIQNLLHYPEQQIKKLEQPEQRVAAMSRRGNL